jgi:hypothetical protein
MGRGRKIIMCLGRTGDILNILPLVKKDHDDGFSPVLCVSKDFESVLDGVSYCERIVYPGPYSEPASAHRWLQQQVQGQSITIAQSYRHPFDSRRSADSYQKEAWRHYGALSEFGKLPLTIDQRDWNRELEISSLPSVPESADVILVCLKGVSSPFSRSDEVMQAIERHFPDCFVYDISTLRAHRVYDLIALYERASCLVSVDTVHLHLCRAAKVPVVAIVNNAYFGSVPPPATVQSVCYGDPELVEKVVDGIKTAVISPRAERFVVHACHTHGKTERHRRAQATWDAACEGEQIIKFHQESWHRTADQIGDPRSVPSVRDILEAACDKAMSGDDVVIFHNSDVALEPGSIAKMRRHASIFGAFTMRRVEPGANYVHIGRELFGFRVDWLRRHLADIPDFWIASPYFDIVLAALIRKERGIITTKQNLAIDFYPCEMSAGMAIHEAHTSNWSGERLEPRARVGVDCEGMPVA